MSTPGKAYSYIRFSTPEQAQGDSLRRQTQMAAEYCARHGLTLDTELTMQDLGVSAYRGKNLDGTGKLGVFLDAVKAGDVAPGAALLLESLDRLTRQSARKAVAILGDIVDLGIDVVTLNDGKRYSKSSFDDIDLVIAVLLMSRAHNESREKGRRVADAWAAKRAGKAGKGYGRNADVLTRSVPGWIRVAEDGARKLIPERAKVVRRIFKLFTEGSGQQAIAKAFNEAPTVPTFGRAKYWHKSYIAKILRSSTVIGTLIPHTDDSTTRTAQTPIEGYYPAVIEKETWDKAQALIETNHKAPASKLIVRNILAGLAHCPLCGGTMTRVWKGAGKKGGIPKLVCAAAKVGVAGMGGICKYTSVPLPLIEGALQRSARAALPEADGTLRDQLQNRRGELEGIENTIEDLVAAVEKSASKALLARLKTREEQRDRLSAELAVIEKQAEGSDSKLFKRRVERYRAAMSAKPFDVGAANVALREMVTKVVVDFANGALVMHWRHDGTSEIVYDAVAHGGLINKELH